MNRAVTCIGAVAVLAIGAVGVTAGSVGATTANSANSPAKVEVDFVVRGDLTGIEGRLHDFNCVERVQPSPFNVRGGDTVAVIVYTFFGARCLTGQNEAIWLLTGQAKGGPPETMGVRLRYGERATQVAFLHPEGHLRWASHVLSPTHVVVDITGYR